MGDDGAAVGAMALNEAIDDYCQACRARLASFVQRHYTLSESIRLQRRSLFTDLLCYPLNALWAVPYLSLRKIVESLATLGWEKGTPLLSRVPSGIRTRYQREIERLLGAELLAWASEWEIQYGRTNGLEAALRASPVLTRQFGAAEFRQMMLVADEEVRRAIEHYSSGRALVSDLAGSAGTVLAGWLLFKDKSLGLLGIGDRLARERAHEAAASHFFLGKGLGSAWYGMFPPEPSTSDVIWATVLVGSAVTCFCLLIGVLSDPLRKAMGLQQRKLMELIDEMELRLKGQMTKAVKTMGSGLGREGPALERRGP